MRITYPYGICCCMGNLINHKTNQLQLTNEIGKDLTIRKWRNIGTMVYMCKYLAILFKHTMVVLATISFNSRPISKYKIYNYTISKLIFLMLLADHVIHNLICYIINLYSCFFLMLLADHVIYNLICYIIINCFVMMTSARLHWVAVYPIQFKFWDKLSRL